VDSVGLSAASLVSDMWEVCLRACCGLCGLVGAAFRNWFVFVCGGCLSFGLNWLVVCVIRVEAVVGLGLVVNGCFGFLLGVVDGELHHGQSHWIALVRDLVFPTGVLMRGLCGAVLLEVDVDCVLLQCSVGLG